MTAGDEFCSLFLTAKLSPLLLHSALNTNGQLSRKRVFV